jgi:MFS superfamily sulfate permease-like transporter
MVLLVIYHASRPHVGTLGRVPGVPDAFGDLERHPDYEPLHGVLVLRLEAPIFYANASVLAERVKVIVGTAEPTPHAVILDVGANGELDITSSEILEQLVLTLRSAGVDFALAEARQPVLDVARRSGLLDTVGPGRIFPTIDAAADALVSPTSR